MSGRFALAPVDIPLPRGAFMGGRRDLLTCDGRPVCVFACDAFRPCLHPVWTPAGHVVTGAHAADHPHHAGIWAAADHVGLLMQGPDGIERYDYNFYVDDVFQGRAPGRIRQGAIDLADQSGETATVEQTLHWTGPREWAAPEGRTVLTETRRTAVRVTDGAVILDIASTVTPAGETAVRLGPTRHAWFNVRVAESIALHPDARLVDARGRAGAEAVSAAPAPAWVGYAGPVAGGAVAGVTMIPAPPAAGWFVTDWGVMTASPVRTAPVDLSPGETARFACRVIAHDGPPPGPRIEGDSP